MASIQNPIPRLTPGQWILGAISLCLFVLSSQIFTLLILLPPPPRARERRKIYKLLLWIYARFLVYSHFNINPRIINESKEDFSKPAVIIANHQSILDIPYTLMLTHKLLIVTNDWADNRWFHFFVGKYIDFFSVNKGLEHYQDDFRKWIAKGYSILIFPEGVRWGSGHIERFHKGAFYLAEKLQVDILPLLLHGDGTINTTRKFYLKSGDFALKIMPRITPDDNAFGSGYSERTRRIQQLYREEYVKLSK